MTVLHYGYISVIKIYYFFGENNMKKVLAILFVLALATPSYSAVTLLDEGDTKFSLYGTVLLVGLYQNVNTNGVTEQTLAHNDLYYAIQGHSNIGFNFSVGNLYSKAEFRFTEDNNAEKGVFRKLYIGYKFDNGLKVQVGRDNTATETYLWYDNLFDDDDGLKGYGTMGLGRQNMLKLSMMNIDLAFIATRALHKNAFLLDGTGTGYLPGSTTPIDVNLKIADEVMPSIELAYNLKFGGLTGKVFGYYSGVSVEGSSTALAGTQREWLNVAATGLALQYYASKVKTVFTAFYALNGNYIGAVRWGADATPENTLKFEKATGNSGKDTWEGYNDIHSWGTALSVGYDILDTLDVTIGGGFQSISTTDNAAFAKYGLLNSYSAYLAFRYTINNYFTIVPTVGYYVNYGTNDVDPYLHGTIVAGAQLRVSF